MITSKQRSYLRGLASKIDPIINIGKSGLTPEVTKTLEEALEARELVKISILNNSMEDIRNVADILSERTRSDVVQIIGKKAVFYRPSKKKVIIELPKK